MKRFFKVLAAALLLACGLAQGQTIVQDQGNTQASQLGAESPLGQSFVTTVNGSVTALGVRSMNQVTATLRIYTGGIGSGVPNNIGAPIYTQANVPLSAATGGAVGPAGGFSTITLTTPLAITAGHTFTFQLTATNPFALAARFGNVYPQGDFISIYGAIPFAGLDAAFQVFEVAAAAPAQATPAAIPTLGEWAMLALAALLAMLARRRLRPVRSDPLHSDPLHL
jgi:hypothetical protein